MACLMQKENQITNKTRVNKKWWWNYQGDISSKGEATDTAFEGGKYPSNHRDREGQKTEQRPSSNRPWTKGQDSPTFRPSKLKVESYTATTACPRDPSPCKQRVFVSPCCTCRRIKFDIQDSRYQSRDSELGLDSIRHLRRDLVDPDHTHQHWVASDHSHETAWLVLRTEMLGTPILLDRQDSDLDRLSQMAV